MHPEDLRADIPALEDAIYLNTGASSPAPRRVVAAATGFQEYHEFRAPVEAGAYAAAYDRLDAARERLGAFLGVPAEHLALTASTADGISRVAAAFDWEPGDVVLRTDLEHPAGVLPWWNLERRHGVEVRTLPTERGRLDMDRLTAELADAKLVCLNSVAWTLGTRLRVEAVVEAAHDAGATVLVDAVQSFGQRRVDLADWNADFVVGAGHKWLLGPWGAGFLYVDPDVARELRPAQVSYRSVRDPGAADPELKPGAGRFEVGTTSIAPYVGLVEALDVIEELGLSAIQSRIDDLAGRLGAGLGDDLRSPTPAESGLVTFDVEDPESTVERLKDRGIHVRSVPLGDGTAVRASVHVFNTPGDVDALLGAL